MSRFDSARPDQVSLDIVMADLNGIETLLNQEEVWKKAMLSGATDYITKPFSYEQLRSNLKLYLPLESENN